MFKKLYILIFDFFGESIYSLTAISKAEKPTSMKENKDVAKRGGKVANVAKVEFEKATGQKAISPLNAKDKPALEVKVKHKLEEKND